MLARQRLVQILACTAHCTFKRRLSGIISPMQLAISQPKEINQPRAVQHKFTRETVMSKTSARSPSAIQNGARGETSHELEFMIRRDLEMEIEKGLEKEIKDDIYRLALQLHRLYQNQEERNIINDGRALAPKKKQKQQKKKKKKARGAFSEVNISIKMDRGAIVEIKETKDQNRACKMQPHETKRLDWARTLRSGAPPVAAIKPIAKKKTPPFVV